MSKPKLSPEQMREVNELMEEAQDDLEQVLFRLVWQRDIALATANELLASPIRHKHE
jgi:hypothetical protein